MTLLLGGRLNTDDVVYRTVFGETNRDFQVKKWLGFPKHAMLLVMSRNVASFLGINPLIQMSPLGASHQATLNVSFLEETAAYHY
jgi:hypothetical protein